MNHTSNLSHPPLAATFAVFPGQGSQHVGMGKELYNNFSSAREIFEEASDAISVDLKKLCFDGPDSDLLLTENTQPCLLTTSVAAFRVAEKEIGFSPEVVAGHSLGEYSALVAIRSIELQQAVRWVRARGQAMQKAVPAGEGTMAAIIGLEDEIVEKLCAQATETAASYRKSAKKSDLSVQAIVEPANFNAPGQVVIAGSVDAVQIAVALTKSDSAFAGGKAIPLSVSAPFHCKLMGPAREHMAEIFSTTAAADRPKRPQCAYIPNRTARVSREEGVIFDLLVDQVNHPVLWKQSVLTLLSLPSSVQTVRGPLAVEFGPGKVLAGLIKRIASHAGKPCSQASMGDSASLKNLESVLRTFNLT